MNRRTPTPKSNVKDPTSSVKRLGELVNPHAAGIDIGGTFHVVAVPAGAGGDGEDVRTFGAFTADLLELSGWLHRCGVTTVAMESTGVYWIPLYDLLEEQGFEVLLVDARQIKRSPARKTDVLDCQLLQYLHSLGMLGGAFRPNEAVCALRSFSRQRDMLITTKSEHIQRIQKAMTQMNIKLQHVISETMGKTGEAIIRAIVGGERDPQRLAALRDRRCQESLDTIAKALQGTWREEHLFALRQALELYDFHQRLIVECDEAIERHLRCFPVDGLADAPPAPRTRHRRRNEMSFDLHDHLIRMTGVDLTRIEGIGTLTALTVVSEIGVDMERWPTDKQFSSWLAVCPGAATSGGRVLSSATKPGANRAANALRIAAQSLSRSDSALGHFLRRKAGGHLGMPGAITATAHKLAQRVYAMLKHGTEYVVQGQQDYERAHREQQLRTLQRRAKQLGHDLVPLVPQLEVP